MTLIWSGVAIVLAVLLQSALSLFLPNQAPLFDPFLLIMAYVSLTRGESNGMLVGAASGWVQELLFGGPLLGLLGLTRVVLAFLVGHAGRRFLLSDASAQFTLIFFLALVEGWLLGRFAGVFEVPLMASSLVTQVMRAVLNAVLGAATFGLIERHSRREEA
jgi:rod shape-determining protein MreD